jgi:hypothetical protein
LSRSNPLGVQYPERSQLQRRRELVKLTLMNQRRPFGILHNICPICREPVKVGDLHEVILTRGKVQKLPDDVKLMAHTPENCVLVHPGNCHIAAATRKGISLCLYYLLAWEGEDAILKWLYSMRPWMDIVEETLMVQSVARRYARIRIEYMAYWYNNKKKRRKDNYVYSWSRPGNNFSG